MNSSARACDRCGREIPGSGDVGRGYRLSMDAIRPGSPVVRVYLCEPCSSRIDCFLKRGGVEASAGPDETIGEMIDRVIAEVARERVEASDTEAPLSAYQGAGPEPAQAHAIVRRGEPWRDDDNAAKEAAQHEGVKR